MSECCHEFKVMRFKDDGCRICCAKCKRTFQENELYEQLSAANARAEQAEAQCVIWKQKCGEANNEIALVYQNIAYCDDDLLSEGAIKVKSTALLLARMKRMEDALREIADYCKPNDNGQYGNMLVKQVSMLAEKALEVQDVVDD